MTDRTPSQTVGPYLHLGLTQGAFGAPEIFGPAVANAGLPGTHIRVEGQALIRGFKRLRRPLALHENGAHHPE